MGMGLRWARAATKELNMFDFFFFSFLVFLNEEALRKKKDL
jgi:hypothetical protein